SLPVVMDADAWDRALESYYDEHDSVGIDASARSPQMLQIDVEDRRWLLRQTLADPEGHHDWHLEAEVDLMASETAGAAVVRATALRRMDQ
ncbi:MAG TPA: DUF3516 domain-containing protein, partial [Candidatus Avipropionibacterium avicola]|nr:DUF3516 domain-containing protein [Candidatus Avipropionibacterium avicola]